MEESFQDYSCFQDFEADFPLKVSLEMLNWEIIIGFPIYILVCTVCLKTIDHKIEIVNI